MHHASKKIEHASFRVSSVLPPACPTQAASLTKTTRVFLMTQNVSEVDYLLLVATYEKGQPPARFFIIF